ncbi:uncharacterized protein LOC114308756 [Camellia sinensis]|uniref:uncharacterized protein LOC114308756 n=1 Tax=Camellia sinensis TaxID=4442 RepID=UPI001036CA11|nr:uncharacterized protein LOC114308756 [Camellia sinensis]
MGGVRGIRSFCALIVGNKSTGFVPSAFVDSLLSGSIAVVAVMVVVWSRALRGFTIIFRKRRLEEFEIVKLSEECSAILQKKLPQKLKDPGSFTFPCTIGNSFFDKVLCDLGISINLMPLSVYRKLGLGKMKQTTISLQLANRSIKYPRGIIENVLVKVDKFIFPVDFVVVDMEKDQQVPLILGRPFLAMGRALIDVQNGELTLRVNKEEIMFNIYQAMRFPEDPSTCFRVDVIKQCVEESFQEDVPVDPLE